MSGVRYTVLVDIGRPSYASTPDERDAMRQRYEIRPSITDDDLMGGLPVTANLAGGHVVFAAPNYITWYGMRIRESLLLTTGSFNLYTELPNFAVENLQGVFYPHSSDI